jgi:hypothetical protein
MSSSKKGQKFAFDRPGTYRIRILGFLDQSWSERLSGMQISSENLEDRGAVTTLSGAVPDQAALSGVLATLNRLRLTLLSVEMMQETNNGI